MISICNSTNNILNNNDFLCKLTESGVFIWVKPISKYISTIKIVRNFIYLVDEIIKLGGGMGNYFHYENINFSKLDLEGNMLWKKSYNTCPETNFSHIDFVLDNNDNIYFNNGILLSGDIFGILKLDSAGNLINSRNFSLLLVTILFPPTSSRILLVVSAERAILHVPLL